MIAEPWRLQKLWVQAFGDTPDVPEAFFATAFASDRFHCILEDDVPVSALYWLDCTLQGQKIAYIYAAATDKVHRGKGLFRKLMNESHQILVQQGYAGVVLVPCCRELFGLYEKFGYRTVTTVEEFTCGWGDVSVPFQEITPDQYAALRKGYLPAGSVLQEGPTLAYLQTQGEIYAGTDFLLAAAVMDGELVAQELLGNVNAAPGILRTLNIPRGRFRTPGPGRAFAMFLPLQANCPVPSYFGLALD